MFKSLVPAFGLALAASTASAHVTLTETEVAVGSTAKFTLRVPHGCAGEATVKVSVKIPEGLVAVKPMPKPGWTLELSSGPYSRSYSTGYSTVTEGVNRISWSGDLPDAYYDEFVFRGTVTDAFAPGSKLYIPVVQQCAKGVERWIDIPAEGQDLENLETPAPAIMIVGPGDGRSH